MSSQEQHLAVAEGTLGPVVLAGARSPGSESPVPSARSLLFRDDGELRTYWFWGFNLLALLPAI